VKRPTDSERLLNEVLSEDAGFKSSSLDATLQAVRHRRAIRHRARVALGTGVAMLALSATVFRPWVSQREGKAEDSGAAVVAPPDRSGVVSSKPLAASMLVETSTRSVTVIESEAASVTLVETVAVSPLLPRIDDAELYVMLAGHPIAIVRLKDAPAELLLLSSERPAVFPGQ
jgi:hypothetical protein